MQAAKTESIWSDGVDLGVEPGTGDLVADACVVGLGGSGLAALETLHRAGLRCVGLDRHGIAAGAAGANGGFLLAGQAAFYHQAVARFGRERAYGIYVLTRQELERRYADAADLCRRTGSLRIAADAAEERDCVHQIDALQRDGLPAEPYLGPEGRGVLFADGYLLAAHAAGDIYVYFRDANVLAVGDVASPANDPELDWITGAWIGGRVSAMDALLKVGNEQTRVVPGTGPMMTWAELKAERDLMETVRQRLFKQIRQGDGPQDMVDGGVLKDLPRTWKDPYKFLYAAAKGLWGNHNKLDPDVV